jgi:cytochrome P450
MLAYMIFEPDLLHVIREETTLAFLNGDSQSPDVKYLDEKCPRLNDIWDEIVRLSAYSSSMRYIIEDTIVDDKILRKGNRVMIFNWQLHFDENVFGDKVREFKPTRFINNDNLIRSGSWRPFEGGFTMCLGRFIAKQVVITLVAMMLQRFHVEPADKQNFPRLEEGNPVLGIMSIKDEDDLSIRLTLRQKMAKY